MGVRRTCRWANEIELTPTHVLLQAGAAREHERQVQQRDVAAVQVSPSRSMKR